MNFYVYENWRAKGHRTKIHQGNCGFCNNGGGLADGTRQDNGKWLGPYKTFKEALESAKSTGADVERCSFCAYSC